MVYEIDDWVNVLISIVDKIIETKQGKIDKNFWENILKNVEVKDSVSGELTKITKIDGWLLNFYPFIKYTRYNQEKLERRNNFNQPISIKELNDFPEELIEVPLIMYNKLNLKKYELSVKTGLIGMIKEDDGVAKAEIGWFISNKVDIEQARKKLLH